jgi:hypothetical protein
MYNEWRKAIKLFFIESNGKSLALFSGIFSHSKKRIVKDSPTHIWYVKCWQVFSYDRSQRINSLISRVLGRISLKQRHQSHQKERNKSSPRTIQDDWTATQNIDNSWKWLNIYKHKKMMRFCKNNKMYGSFKKLLKNNMKYDIE